MAVLSYSRSRLLCAIPRNVAVTGVPFKIKALEAAESCSKRNEAKN